MDGRGTGRTTQQMNAAPRGAVFVWCNSHTHYPIELAKMLGRVDLVVRPLSWLELPCVMGQTFSGVVVDHAAMLRPKESEVLNYVRTHIRIEA